MATGATQPHIHADNCVLLCSVYSTFSHTFILQANYASHLLFPSTSSGLKAMRKSTSFKTSKRHAFSQLQDFRHETTLRSSFLPQRPGPGTGAVYWHYYTHTHTLAHHLVESWQISVSAQHTHTHSPLYCLSTAICLEAAWTWSSSLTRSIGATAVFETAAEIPPARKSLAKP